MTGFVTIPNSDLDPESPVTTSLMTALRDNPIAITEKAVGAPVLGNGYVVTAMIGNEQVTMVKLPNAVVGNYAESEEDSGSTTSPSYTKTAECRVARPGNYRVRLTVSGLPQARARIYINNSAVGAEHGSGVYFEDFLSLAAGDLVQAKGWTDNVNFPTTANIIVLSGNPLSSGKQVLV